MTFAIIKVFPLGFIGGLITDLGFLLKDWIFGFVEWLWTQANTTLFDFLDRIMILFPSIEMELEQFKVWCKFAEMWIPLNFGLTMVVTYFTFNLVVSLIRWILAIAPFVGD